MSLSFHHLRYITLFMWTPVLKNSAVEEYGLGTPPPYGVIFSLLMATLMLGSHAFQILTANASAVFTPQVCEFGFRSTECMS